MQNKFLIGFLLAQIFIFSCVTVSNATELNRQQRIDKSPQWNGEKFQNSDPVPDVEVIASIKTFWDYYFNRPEDIVPEKQLPSEPFVSTQWNGRRDLQFAWLGHATFLIKLENKVVLTDPLFSQRTGPFGWLSPKRYSNTITSMEKLPSIDVVLITHNHYDHLNKDSIKAIKSKTNYFVVPLAVGKLLEKWGVSQKKIIELDWWQNTVIDDLTITAAPAKHTSERGMLDKSKTLWVSYGIQGKKHNLYISGDSGWHKGLYEIGERLGPFDVTFFDIGAYGEQEGWKEIHYTPEEAVKAHQAVNGKLIVPSGWATFNLALFPWYEPIQRFLQAANETRTDYLTPKIGEVVNYRQEGGSSEWWKPFMKGKDE